MVTCSSGLLLKSMSGKWRDISAPTPLNIYIQWQGNEYWCFSFFYVYYIKLHFRELQLCFLRLDFFGWFSYIIMKTKFLMNIFPLRNQQFFISRVKSCLCDHTRFIRMTQSQKTHTLEEIKYVSFSGFTRIQLNAYSYPDAVSFKLCT